jgi:penicillin amidase
MFRTLRLLLPIVLSACAGRHRPPPGMHAEVAGLASGVEVRLDELGVPHIRAANMDDAAAATGFLHARDRGFQLELLRLAGQGRLTELFGERMLQVDRRLRILTVGLADLEANLPPIERTRLNSYVEGINAGLRLSPVPAEFRLLRYNPSPWTIRDVLGVARLQAWDLSGDAEKEAVRARIQSLVGETQATLLLSGSPDLGVSIVDPQPGRRPPLGNTPAPPEGLPLLPIRMAPEALGPAPVSYRAEPTRADPNLAVPHTEPLQLANLSPEQVEAYLMGLGAGSNAWAIHGSRTPDGRPILAGDPHLSLGWPPVFYEVHIITPEINVSGATFPGLPMVVIGRSQSVAWSLTTSYADTQDLWRLERRADQPGQYFLDGQPQTFGRIPQVYRSKDGVLLEEDLLTTVFGPLYDAGREDRLAPGTSYALSWPGFDTGPLPLVSAFDSLYAAPDGTAVIAAVTRLPIPSQNWVFATKGGQIGWVLGGSLPNERAQPFPQEGNKRPQLPDAPMEEAKRPWVIDPTAGYIVASNQPAFTDIGLTGHSFSGSWRSLRIHQALESRSTWSTAASRGLQTDTVSVEAAAHLPVLLRTLGDVGKLDPTSQAMVSALSNWNYSMDGDRAEPLMWMAWRHEIHRTVAARHLADPAIAKAWLDAQLSEAPIDRALLGPTDSPLWDDPATPTHEDLSNIAQETLARTAIALVELQGKDPATWNWGSAHRLRLNHPMAGVPLIGRKYRVTERPIGGGRHTLAAFDDGGPTGSFVTEKGPALRQVVSPGGEAGFVLPGGNSGHPGHPHALDQLEAYLVNHQHQAGISTSQVVEPGVVERVVLEPPKK